MKTLILFVILVGAPKGIDPRPTIKQFIHPNDVVQRGLKLTKTVNGEETWKTPQEIRKEAFPEEAITRIRRLADLLAKRAALNLVDPVDVDPAELDAEKARVNAEITAAKEKPE